MHVWRTQRNNARIKSALFSFRPSSPFCLSPCVLLSCAVPCCGCGSR
nr:MAG TPA: hypothetical protein [Caudoviricetes sp.]